MKVAVLGQGSIGRRHAGILRDLGCAVATYDPLDGGSEAAVLEGADAAVVASPSSEHERQALAAVARGIPVLVEKPLALTAAGAERIESEAARAGVAVDVAMNLRHHPGVLTVREMLPAIGPVARCSAWCGSWLPGWRPGTDYRLSYSAQRALGGGVLLDAIHEIDYVLWLLGAARRAIGMSAANSSLEVDAEHVSCLLIEHDDGPLSAITLDYLDRDYHRGCRMVGEEGTVDWDWHRGTVRLHGPSGQIEERAAPPDVTPTYFEQMRRFLRVVDGDCPPLVGAGGGRAALAIVDAIRLDEVSLRPAGFGDAEALLRWRNDPATRQASRNTGLVAGEEHAAWLARTLGDPGQRLFLIVHRGTPAGSVRLSRTAGDRAEIHIALAPEARGRRIAGAAIGQACERAARELRTRTVEARVREDNQPSLRAFGHAGFAEETRSGGWVTLAWPRGAETSPTTPTGAR